MSVAGRDTCARLKPPCIEAGQSNLIPTCPMPFATPTPVSPVSSLPVELLSRIFFLGFQDARDSNISGVPNFEVVVSHVNTYWRSVAIRETRKLWTLVHLSDVTHLDRAKTYLERSSCMLIDVVIDTESSEDHIPGRTLFRDEFRPVFDIVIPHISRWRSFILKVRDNQCTASARARLSTCGPAPSLDYLQLYHVECSTLGAGNLWISTIRPPVIFFDGQLPSLTGLSLIGVNFPWAASHSPFIKGLKSLELALHCETMRPTYDQWETMLRRCPTLEKLSLHYSGPRISPGWPDEPICLPALTELAIADLDPDHLCSIFQRLTLTKIKCLRLELPDQDYTPFLDLVRGPKANILSHISHLRIDSLQCAKESWRGFLMSTPSVTTFEVDFRQIPSGFGEVLFYADGREEARRQEQDTILPNLSVLRVSGLSGSFLGRFDQFRNEMRRPIDKYWVNKSCRDTELDVVFSKGKVVYFEDEEYEAYTDDGEDYLDGDRYDW